MFLYDFNVRVPDVVLVKLDRREVYYGVELEYELKQGMVINSFFAPTEYRILRDEWVPRTDHDKLSRFVICKHDGSLTRGLEICTIPAKPSVHLEWARQFFVPTREVKIEEELVVENNPFEVRETCGMHVHVSKRPLTKLAITNIVQLLNSPKNRLKVTAIAGRNCVPQYANYKKYLRKDVYLYAKEPKAGPNFTRYEAVNLHSNNTLEIRIFRSPRTLTEFTERLMFVVAVVEWARQCRHLTSVWQRFADWTHSQEHLKAVWGYL